MLCRSGGVETGWNTNKIKVKNYWGFDCGLGVILQELGVEKELTILNIYGPYQDHSPYWEALAQKSFIKTEMLILGGDLNFSLGNAEIWGPRARHDSLSGFL
jgi:hypothetical protein